MDMKRVVKNAAQMVGIAKLRKSQVKPINDILEGRDTMVVARPSAGKSANLSDSGVSAWRGTNHCNRTAAVAYARSGAQAA